VGAEGRGWRTEREDGWLTVDVFGGTEVGEKAERGAKRKVRSNGDLGIQSITERGLRRTQQNKEERDRGSHNEEEVEQENEKGE
jgi:hypothetical protein